MKRILNALFAVGLSAGSMAAHPADPNLCSPQLPAECLNGVSSSVTALDTLRISTRKPPEGKEEEERRKRAALGPLHVAAAQGTSGLLAEDTAAGWGVWGGYGRARFEGSVAVAPYTAKLHSARLGADKTLGERFILGAALIFDRLDTDTRFNGGGQDADTTTFAPYLVFRVNDVVSIDLNAGTGRVDADQHRIDPASAPGAPRILTASFDGRRKFWSATFNAMKPIGDWTVGGRVGYLDSREDQDGYTETGGPSARTVLERNLKLAQVFAGVDAAYRFHDNLELYAGGIYRRDSSRDDGGTAGGLPSAVGSTQPSDRTESEWTLGVRFFGGRSLTLGAEWVKTTGRDRFKHDAINLLARYDF